MNNILISRKPQPKLTLNSLDSLNGYTKYTYLSCSNSNFVEVISSKLQLTKDEIKDPELVSKVDEFFGHELYELKSEFCNRIRNPSLKNRDFCFKQVKNSEIIKEFSVLASKIPELKLKGDLNYMPDEYMNETILTLEVSNGEVKVLV